eukprot:3569640-Rhodomonas_salina.1
MAKTDLCNLCRHLSHVPSARCFTKSGAFSNQCHFQHVDVATKDDFRRWILVSRVFHSELSMKPNLFRSLVVQLDRLLLNQLGLAPAEKFSAKQIAATMTEIIVFRSVANGIVCRQPKSVSRADKLVMQEKNDFVRRA